MEPHNDDGLAVGLRKLLLSHGVLFNNEGDPHVKAYKKLVKRLKSGTREEIVAAVDKMREELSKVKTNDGRTAINVKAIEKELERISQSYTDGRLNRNRTATTDNVEQPPKNGADINLLQKASHRCAEEWQKLEDKVESLQITVQEKDKIILKLQGDIKSEKRRFDEISQMNIKLKDELKQMQGGTLIRRTDKKVKDLIEEKQKLKNELDQADKDKNFWMQRVSKLAGAKMSDGNPGIADLSDPNRPMKIAERYGEIYDNQWTNAFETLTEEYRSGENSKSPETEVIKKLLKILDDIYKQCNSTAKVHRKDLTSAVFMETMNSQSDRQSSPAPEVVKQIKDLQKSTALRTVNCLKKMILTPEMKEKEAPAVAAYMESCIDVCWLMAVQDPPVIFHRGDESEGAKFESDKFVFYTKSGTQLDFLVWPALLLNENGPLLRKGVAQPS